MAKIEDFGQRIEGAAKDRWRLYAARLGEVPEGDIAAQPLSKSFPEPNYGGLIEDGLQPQAVAFLRAVRDRIPPKPRGRGVEAWARGVVAVRGMCQDLIEGRLSIETLMERLSLPAHRSLGGPLEGAVALYLELGHETSLKGYKLEQALLRERHGVRFDAPQRHWMIEGPPRSGSHSGAILAIEPMREAAVAALRARLEAEAAKGPASAKITKFKIYSYRTSPGTVWIGHKIGRQHVDLESFPDARAARAYLAEHADLLEERLAQRRGTPSERRGENRAREGRDWRGGRDIGPAEFQEAFGFRGVQWGNSVEGWRRQQDLNDAWDALHDLASALGWAPASLSLGGRLALAFGARGRGGARPYAAHYECDEEVINLTKARGPGSLAHEWFHALDNAVARRAGRPHGFASERLGGEGAERLVAGLRDALKGTGIPARSALIDRMRTTPYWGTVREMTARAFEAWVIDRLAGRGVRNDWLANIRTEAEFEVEAELMGQAPGRYPYPREAEIGTLGAAFERIFGSTGPVARLFEDAWALGAEIPPAAAPGSSAEVGEHEVEIDWGP